MIELSKKDVLFVESEGLFASLIPHAPGCSEIVRTLPLTVRIPSNTKRHLMRCLFVESRGFEPLSKHSMIYAFYMLSFSLIVGRGKVSRVPIPFSVVAVSHRMLSNITPASSIVRCP